MVHVWIFRDQKREQCEKPVESSMWRQAKPRENNPLEHTPETGRLSSVMRPMCVFPANCSYCFTRHRLCFPENDGFCLASGLLNHLPESPALFLHGSWPRKTPTETAVSARRCCHYPMDTPLGTAVHITNLQSTAALPTKYLTTARPRSSLLSVCGCHHWWSESSMPLDKLFTQRLLNKLLRKILWWLILFVNLTELRDAQIAGKM